MKYGSHKVKYDIMFLFLAKMRHRMRHWDTAFRGKNPSEDFQQIDNIAFVKATRDLILMVFKINPNK